MTDDDLSVRFEAAIRRQWGDAVRSVSEPRPADPSFGPGAFEVDLFVDDPTCAPPELLAPLLLRVPTESDAGASDAERAALELCATHGVAAPAVVAALTPSEGAPALLLTTRPHGTAFVELLQQAERADHEIRDMAVYQLGLHRIRLSDEDSARLGGLDLDAELAGLAGAGLDRAVAWLERSRDRGELDGPAVLCHGGLQPFTLSREDTAEGVQLVARNWTSAVGAPADHDVAASMVSFWAAPYFAERRSDRLVMKVVRDLLSREYLSRYEEERPVERPRLEAWTVFHTAILAARCTGAYHGPRPRVTEVPDDLAEAATKHALRLTRQFRR
jgi:hypothetical protein